MKQLPSLSERASRLGVELSLKYRVSMTINGKEFAHHVNTEAQASSWLNTMVARLETEENLKLLEELTRVHA